MILHQVESLAAAGVKDIVLAVNYRPEVMINVLQKVCMATLLLDYIAINVRVSTKSNTGSRSHSLLKQSLLEPPDL